MTNQRAALQRVNQDIDNLLSQRYTIDVEEETDEDSERSEKDRTLLEAANDQVR